MWTAAVETSLFVVGGISAGYLLKNRHPEFFLKSFKIALVAAILVTPLQIYLGDGSGQNVFQYQPTKGAAIESHWDTNPAGQGADFALVGVVCGYTLLGATYLIIKTEGDIQRRCARWARLSAWLMMTVAVAVTLWTPWLNSQVARKGFQTPPYLALLPTLAGVAFVMLLQALRRGRE